MTIFNEREERAMIGLEFITQLIGSTILLGIYYFICYWINQKED